MLRIHLFGPLRLFYADQPWPFAALPRTLALCAYLLLHRSAPLSRAPLAFTLWPDVPEAEARANLRRHLHDLRRALPPAPPDQPWLLSGASHLQWNPHAPVWLDVAEFERLCSEPQQLTAAVALYSGELLPHLDTDWVLPERERLAHQYGEALEQLIVQHRAQHDYVQAIGYARQLLQHDPLREDTLRDLLELLMASGDRSGALREYQQFAQRLQEELGVAPLPETIALAEAIRRNALLPDTPSAVASARYTLNVTAAASPAAPPPHNLPAMLTSFHGREAELATVCQMLSTAETDVRLLTLSGSGGSGKTRLAQEAAQRLLREAPEHFPDGVFFVSLAALSDPELMAPTIAATLNIKESSSRTLLESLTDVLRSKRVLLVLDNVEQLLDAASLVSELLTVAPGLRVLITSRIALQLYGEHEYPVLPLPLPPLDPLPALDELSGYAAVRLFVERAQAVQSSFNLTEANAPALAAICVELDGLPLALELAAARSKLHAPEAILERLTDRLRFLTSQTRNVATRQQTLRATIDWSYQLLRASEQRLFARLAVFAGVFTLDAVEAICGASADACAPALEHEAVTTLESLVNQSMVRPLAASDPDGEPQFRLLLTLREYALEQLHTNGELDVLRRRHAQYYLALVERAEPKLMGSRQQVWLERLEAAHDNLRAVLGWALDRNEAEIAARLCGALARFWSWRGHFTEARRWMVLVLSQRGLLSAPVHANLLYVMGLMWGTFDHVQAIMFLEESLELYRQLEDWSGLARTLNTLGSFMREYVGDYHRGRELLQESLQVSRDLGDRYSIQNALFNLGALAQFEQDYDQARSLFEEALAINWEIGNTRGVAWAQAFLGLVAHSSGDEGRARALLTESMELFRALGDTLSSAECRRYFGAALLHAGDYNQAMRLFQESLRLYQELEGREGIATCMGKLACIAGAQGQAVQAAQLWGAAEQLRATVAAAKLPLDYPGEDERALAAVRAQLGEAAFASAWAAGQAMTMEQAIAAALDISARTQTLT